MGGGSQEFRLTSFVILKTLSCEEQHTLVNYIIEFSITSCMPNICPCPSLHT